MIRFKAGYEPSGHESAWLTKLKQSPIDERVIGGFFEEARKAHLTFDDANPNHCSWFWQLGTIASQESWAAFVFRCFHEKRVPRVEIAVSFIHGFYREKADQIFRENQSKASADPRDGEGGRTGPVPSADGPEERVRQRHDQVPEDQNDDFWEDF